MSVAFLIQIILLACGHVLFFFFIRRGSCAELAINPTRAPTGGMCSHFVRFARVWADNYAAVHVVAKRVLIYASAISYVPIFVDWVAIGQSQQP